MPSKSKAGKTQADSPEAGGIVDDGFERSMWRQKPLLSLATLLGPFLLTALILYLIYYFAGQAYLNKLAWSAVATFFLLGRFAILLGDAPASEGLNLSQNELFAMVLYMDVMVATLLSFHVGFMFKIPILGGKLRSLEEDGRFILKSNPWMRRITFLGIVAFVMFPLAATGSVGGSIFGRLLGMSRKNTFIGVAIGSLMGCSLMYFGATIINKYVGEYPWVKYLGGGALVLLIIYVLNSRYRKLKAKRMSMS